jgi:hypothetical protein
MVGQLEVARNLALPLATATGVEAAFLAGSLTAGLGNAASDVDLYTLGPELPSIRNQVFADSMRVDVHCMPTSEFELAIRHVVAGRLPSDGSAPVVAERDLMLAVYLTTGEVLLDRGALAPLVSEMHDNAALLRRLVISHWLTKAYFELEDLAGLVGESDWQAAAMVSRELQIVAGKALMAACGDLYAGRKWLWRQLARSAPESFPVQRFATTMQVVLRAGREAEVLTEVRHLAQTCLVAAATLGWQGIPMWRWPRWHPGDGGLVRNDLLSVRVYTDAVLLAFPDGRRVRLGHDVALVWGLCDGVPTERAVDEAVALHGTADAYAKLTADRVRAILRRLVGTGLVRQAS